MPQVPPASNRRTVLKGAAWTAPAIVLATAAPAAALSGAANVTQSVSGVVNNTTLLLTTTVSFINANTGATTATAIVRLAASAGQMGGAAPTSVSAGWGFVSATPVGSAGIREYTFSGAIPGAPDASSTASSFLSFVVPVEPASLGGLSVGTIRVTTTAAAPAAVTPNPTTGGWG